MVKKQKIGTNLSQKSNLLKRAAKVKEQVSDADFLRCSSKSVFFKKFVNYTGKHLC